MRVAFVFPHATTGGAEAYLARVMDRLGPDWIAGVAVLRDGPFVAELRGRGADPLVIDTPARPLAMLRSALELRRWEAVRGAEVVHANGLKAGLIAGLACVGRRPPVVWMKHDLAGSGPLSFIVALLSREVVAVSSAASAGVPRPLRRRVGVIYDGLPDHRPDAAAGRAEACRLLACDPDAEVIVHVGRLCPGKGQAETIAVAGDVLAERPRARFLLLGEEDPSYPGYRSELLARLRSLGLEGRVVLAGHRDDAVALIAGADLLVAPSVRDPAYGWSEGFGLAAAEAMWVGTPVVAYANGSLPEVLDGAGIVVPEGDRSALARAVAALLADASGRAELASAGTRLAHSRYRIDDAVEALRSRYRALAAGARPARSRSARRA